MPQIGVIVNQNHKKIKEKVRLKKTDLKTEVFAIAVFQSNATRAGCNALKIPVDVKFTISI